MEQPQLIFDRLVDHAEKKKQLAAVIKDALESNGEYQEALDKTKTINETKKRIKQAIAEQFSSEMQKLDDLKIDMESDREMLTDVVMTAMSKGENIPVLKDKYQNEYEPVFKVIFKKTNTK